LGDVIVPRIAEIFHVTPQQHHSLRNSCESAIITIAYVANRDGIE
jgi:hypothetical protein